MISDNINIGEYKMVAHENFDNFVLCHMKITEWEQFVELFNITSSPHAVVLDFSDGEHFYSQ